jgi:hypothetical protein
LHPHFQAAINLKEFTPTRSPLETHSLDHGHQLFVFPGHAPNGGLPKHCRNAKFISQFASLRILLCCAKFQLGVGALRGTPTLYHQDKSVAISTLTVSLLQWD